MNASPYPPARRPEAARPSGPDPDWTATPDPGSVLVVGEALVDVVRRADRVDRHPGGSPANVAVGLAALGHPVRLATSLGDDADGDLIRAHLGAAGVRLDPAAAADRTSSAIATMDRAGSATYEFDLRWRLARVDLRGAAHLHTGSVAVQLAPGATEVLDAVSRATSGGLTTSYDPNLRPSVIGPADQVRPGVEALVRACDVVKVSDEDLAWLYPDTTPERSAARWSRWGPALVVLTCGAAGALAWAAPARSPAPGGPDDPRRTTGPGRQAAPVRFPARPVSVIDTVGAGDSFMAGLLSGLLDGGLIGDLIGGPGLPATSARRALRAAGPSDVRDALTRALATSAITCTRPGAAAPTRADLAGLSPGILPPVGSSGRTPRPLL